MESFKFGDGRQVATALKLLKGQMKELGGDSVASEAIRMEIGSVLSIFDFPFFF